MILTLDQFREERPNVARLREKYPELTDLLTGTFASAPRDYTSEGLPRVSWELLQGKRNSPTYEMIGLCDGIEVDTNQNYNEVVHVLEGKLNAGIKGVRGEYTRGKGPLIALLASSLKLSVKDSPVIYFCEYKITGIAIMIKGRGEKIIPFYGLNQLKDYSLKEVDSRRDIISLKDDNNNILKINAGLYRIMKQQDYVSGKDAKMDALISGIDARLSPKF